MRRKRYFAITISLSLSLSLSHSLTHSLTHHATASCSVPFFAFFFFLSSSTELDIDESLSFFFFLLLVLVVLLLLPLLGLLVRLEFRSEELERENDEMMVFPMERVSPHVVGAAGAAELAGGTAVAVGDSGGDVCGGVEVEDDAEVGDSGAVPADLDRLMSSRRLRRMDMALSAPGLPITTTSTRLGTAVTTSNTRTKPETSRLANDRSSVRSRALLPRSVAHNTSIEPRRSTPWRMSCCRCWLLRSACASAERLGDWYEKSARVSAGSSLRIRSINCTRARRVRRQSINMAWVEGGVWVHICVCVGGWVTYAVDVVGVEHRVVEVVQHGAQLEIEARHGRTCACVCVGACV